MLVLAIFQASVQYNNIGKYLAYF